jgi:transcriptional regulator
MYVPKHFEVSDRAWCHALIRAEPFATLVGADDAGTAFATHLPFLLDAERGPLGTLIGHVARANPQWRYFRPGQPVFVIFQGPHAYVSPAWYEAHPSVPTWNYVAVHAYGVPAVFEDPARVKALLAALVRTFEAGHPDPWRFESLADDYVDGMLRGIVAFEIPIDRLEGKAKLSQNRSAADRARVGAALEAAADPLARAVASLMAPGRPTQP